MTATAVVTPRLAPLRDGLGDYCRRLWEAWPGAPPPWSLLVVEGAAASRAAWPAVTIAEFPLGEGGLSHALAASGARTTVLHFVPYAYHPKGCPRWLPGELARWRRGAADRRLAVMFHEIWADGPPWRRSFWTRPTQASITIAVARLADVAFTSVESLQRELHTRAGVGAPLLRIPSNIPVVTSCWAAPPAADRLQAWVFGLPRIRREAIELHRGLLAALEAVGRLGRVVVAGSELAPGDLDSPEARALRAVVPAARIEIAGELGAAEISARLAACHLALIRTPPSLGPKSGTAMAALAHACPIVVPAERACEGPLREGIGVLSHDGSAPALAALATLSCERLAEVGRAGQDWYRHHADWPLVAAGWRDHLERL